MEQNQAIYLALIAVAGSVVASILAIAAPWLMAKQASDTRAQERKEDYNRQDQVADRAAAVAARAELVAIKVDVSAQTIAEANQQIVRQSQDNGGKLDIIHTLVNSSLTQSKQFGLDVLVKFLALMMKDPAGNAVEIAETKQQAVKLRKEIAEMNEAAAVVNQQIHAQVQTAAMEAARVEERKAAPAPAAPAPAAPAPAEDPRITAAKADIAKADAVVEAKKPIAELVEAGSPDAAAAPALAANVVLPPGPVKVIVSGDLVPKKKKE